MSFRTEHENLEAKVARAQQEALDARSWWRFIAAHPEVINCSANYNMAQSMLDDISTPFTLETLESVFASDPAFRQSLALQTTEEERARALAEYHVALTARGGSPTAIQSEFDKAKYLSADQIKAKTDELKRHAEISAMPVEDIRKLANSKPAPEQVELPLNMTREFLFGLNRPGDFKRVCERYGVAAVTRRLNDRR